MKRITKRLILCSIIQLAFLGCINAQKQTDKELLYEEFAKIRNAYMATKNMKTNISYYYSGENTSQKILDSLHGTVYINGKNYRVVIDSTEMMVNENYLIVLFKEDKLMHISKAFGKLTTYNPLVAMDSFLNKNNGIKIDITNSGQSKSIQFVYPSGESYKKVQMIYDEATGYLQKILMVVKTSLLAPEMDAQSIKEEGYDEYSIVETIYSKPQMAELPTDFFDEKSFFVKKEKSFVVTEKYKDYKIFLGSPNL